jgi:hypothetical protein
MSTLLRRALAVTAILIVFVIGTAARAGAQSEPFSNRWTAPTADNETTTTGVFSGTFRNWPIDTVKLTLTAADPASGCPPVTTATIEYPRPAPSEPPPATRDFSFQEGDVVCNGTYDARAESQVKSLQQGAEPRTIDTLVLRNITVAVPARPPGNVAASPENDGTVELSWTNGYADVAPPPDFEGFQLYRVDSDGNRQQILPRPTTSTSYGDVDVPASGTYTYDVEARRSGAEPSTARSGSVTVTVPAGSSLTGRPSSTTRSATAPATPGAPASSPAQQRSGPPAFTQDGLALGDGEAGGPAGPRVAAVRVGDGPRGSSGQGLLEPVAGALAAAVWAALLLWLSRRATRAARASPVVVELEHAS